MVKFLESKTKQQQTDIIAQYLRNDCLYQAKNKEGSNLRNILIGLACEWTRFREKINEIYDEYDPATTTNLIEEWEKTVGLPDDCLTNTGTIEERRANVLFKIAGINATTAKQFEDVAAVFGIDVTVRSGNDPGIGFLPYDLPFLLLEPGSQPFTIVVDLPSDLQPDLLPHLLPFDLVDPFPRILQCLFNKLKPANTQVVFRYV